MKFVKMHGLGNDYIYFDCLHRSLENPSDVAVHLSDRHFGIGGDGIVLILPSENADYRMRMFNADGSEAEMCGNAIRCVGKYLRDTGATDQDRLRIETGAGVLDLALQMDEGKVSSVRVDMGEPILEGPSIPTQSSEDRLINYSLEVDGENLSVTCLSMGNPHCVLFRDELSHELVHGLGPRIETHPFFPKRTNVEFARVFSRDVIELRVWERGSGETMACGTGACAAVVAASLNEKGERSAAVRLLGGELQIEWAENNHVYMTGPATYVFEGEVDL